MTVKELTVLNEFGLHARVACRITRKASEFESSICIMKDGKSYDLKSVSGVITTNARQGDVLTVEINGPDEEKAAEGMEELFLNKFGER